MDANEEAMKILIGLSLVKFVAHFCPLTSSDACRVSFHLHVCTSPPLPLVVCGLPSTSRVICNPSGIFTLSLRLFFMTFRAQVGLVKGPRAAGSLFPVGSCALRECWDKRTLVGLINTRTAYRSSVALKAGAAQYPVNR